MKTLAIIGSGDLGQQLAHYALSDLHYSSVVFFDDFSEEKIVNDIPIIGRTADIEKTLVVGVHGPKEVYCFLVDRNK